jgi:hypothetical protein
MIDLAKSALLSPETDVSEANVDGGTVRVESFFHLDNVFYSILTWEESSLRCEEDQLGIACRASGKSSAIR